MTVDPAPPAGRVPISRIRRRAWLTEDTFILGIERPPEFEFQAGQHIRLFHGQTTRDYSLIPGRRHDEMILLIRRVSEGLVSDQLSSCPKDSPIQFSGPHGYFTYRPSPRPPVLVATGTGIAPFAAMCFSGLTGFTLLHGVRNPRELYFREILAPAARLYMPCLTRHGEALPQVIFPGRVTAYLANEMAAGEYDFYLSGRREMIAEALAIIDQQFPSSRVYSETFF